MVQLCCWPLPGERMLLIEDISTGNGVWEYLVEIFHCKSFVPAGNSCGFHQALRSSHRSSSILRYFQWVFLCRIKLPGEQWVCQSSAQYPRSSTYGSVPEWLHMLHVGGMWHEHNSPSPLPACMSSFLLPYSPLMWTSVCLPVFPEVLLD